MLKTRHHKPYKSSRKLILAALLSSTVVAAGCGSTTVRTLTEQARTVTVAPPAPNYVAQLSAICERYQPQVQAIGRSLQGLGTGTTAGQLTALGTQAEDLYGDVIAAINATSVPSSASAAVGRWAADLNDAKAEIAAAVTDSETRNDAAARLDETRLTGAVMAAGRDRGALRVAC